MDHDHPQRDRVYPGGLRYLRRHSNPSVPGKARFQDPGQRHLLIHVAEPEFWCHAVFSAVQHAPFGEEVSAGRRLHTQGGSVDLDSVLPRRCRWHPGHFESTTPLYALARGRL